ncbi:Uncharacterised protein [BD1-7 clade bacterium]|uniref:Uncharacterized protein n=1 Tax=BD1-7 clade bacterium TaxID=2029982 RepID=A0A5S9QV40_9GAMM|nr:Uncharacterised protein [BD1-7 clade bacterium]CAA0122900.1 Uncharacterised protein [BD1-7 clade bacterium]
MRNIDFSQSHDAFENDAHVMALAMRFTGSQDIRSVGKAYAHLTATSGSEHEHERARRFSDRELMEKRRFYLAKRMPDGSTEMQTIEFMPNNILIMSPGLVDFSQDMDNIEASRWKLLTSGHLAIGDGPLDSATILARKKISASTYRIAMAATTAAANESGVAANPSAQSRTLGVLSSNLDVIRALDISRDADDLIIPFTDSGVSDAPYLYTVQRFRSAPTAAGTINNYISEALGLSENDWFIGYFALGNQTPPNFGTPASDCPNLESLIVDSENSTSTFGFITYSAEDDKFSCYSDGRSVLSKAVLENCNGIASNFGLSRTFCSPFLRPIFERTVNSALSNADQTFSFEENGELRVSDSAHVASHAKNVFTYITRFAESVVQGTQTGNLICVDSENDVSSLRQCSKMSGNEAILFTDASAVTPANEANGVPGYQAAAKFAALCGDNDDKCAILSSDN